MTFLVEMAPPELGNLCQVLHSGPRSHPVSRLFVDTRSWPDLSLVLSAHDAHPRVLSSRVPSSTPCCLLHFPLPPSQPRRPRFLGPLQVGVQTLCFCPTFSTFYHTSPYVDLVLRGKHVSHHHPLRPSSFEIRHYHSMYIETCVKISDKSDK